MQTKKLIPFLLLLALSFMPFADTAQAVSARSFAPAIPPQEGIGTEASTGADPDDSGQQVQSLSGSFVAFDPSIGGAASYVPGVSQTLCFRSETYTNDYEYANSNWLRFPNTWNVTNVYVEGTPVCDSGASWGAFSWSFQTPPYEVNIVHARYQSMTDHCVANYCVVVTPEAAAIPAPVSWYFDGDGYGGGPHNPCSSDEYTPVGQNPCDEHVNPPASVPFEGTGLFFLPNEITASGCHGEQQIHEVNLYNFTGSETAVNLSYSAPWGVVFTGPSVLTIPDGAYSSFFVTFDPHICKDDGEITVTIEATDGIETATFELHEQVFTFKAEWQQLATNSAVAMDNVLGAYSGKLWQITGYGTTGVSNYDPLTNTLAAIASSAPPFGQNYARSGCQYGNKVFMYGDANTPAFTGLWSYNMDNNVWTAETPSGSAPPLTGIWAPAWVSDPDNHLCYMTGGANTAGTGTLNSVFVYDLVANAWLPPLPSFTTPRDFHAAFLFKRPADSHKLLCVAGGNFADAGLSGTQCYDFTAGIWYPENADLGALPATLWGMGYAMLPAAEGDNLWFVNGVDSVGALANISWRLNTATGVWEDLGPLPGGPVYRLSAVVLDNMLYQSGGSTGGFSPSGLLRRFTEIICEACVVPDIVKEATAEALPGERITYSIEISQFPDDKLYVLDLLPAGLSYVPGSLIVTPDVGDYGYADTTRTIYWFVEPDPPPTNQWKPAAINGAAVNEKLSLSGGSAGPGSVQSPHQSRFHDTLWDQPLSTVNTAAYVDQEFTDLPGYSSFLADDFTADAPWTIESFHIPGSGWNGFSTLFDATQLTFMIYADDMGIPAGDPSGSGDPPLWVINLLPTDPQVNITTGTDGYPSNVELELNSPVMLPPGQYWFIFYPTMSFANGGQYGRQPADTLNSSMAQFVNPGGVFGFGTDWQPWTILGPVQQDLAFSIFGTAVQSVMISFQADVYWPQGVLYNYGFLYYGDKSDYDSALTFTGNGVFLPITMKE
ncbi:MAG: kelch repeat-containing protein [Anaerolineaceae bacterium]